MSRTASAGRLTAVKIPPEAPQERRLVRVAVKLGHAASIAAAPGTAWLPPQPRR